MAGQHRRVNIGMLPEETFAAGDWVIIHMGFVVEKTDDAYAGKIASFVKYAPEPADPLTTFDLDEYVFNALRAGASGFLLKDSPLSTLLDGIATVARGDALLAPSVTRRLIAEFASQVQI